MAVLREAFELVRLAGGSLSRPGRHRPMVISRMDHRQLAHTIRQMPDRFHGRLPERTLAKISDAAAAGQWEKAVNKLITSLSAYAEPITPDEREEFRTVLTALHMPVRRADTLTLRH